MYSADLSPFLLKYTLIIHISNNVQHFFVIPISDCTIVFVGKTTAIGRIAHKCKVKMILTERFAATINDTNSSKAKAFDFV